MKSSELDSLRVKLLNKEREYLEYHGWKTTCSLPGSFGLWEKEIKNRVIIVSKETAIEIQKRL